MGNAQSSEKHLAERRDRSCSTEVVLQPEIIDTIVIDRVEVPLVVH
jgi:hypothetical protein